MDVSESIREQGFAVALDRPHHRDHPEATALAAFWNDLPVDTHMADGGTYRRRRYSRFMLKTSSGAIEALPHRAYGQSARINRFAGDRVRQFEPLSPGLVSLDLFTALVKEDFSLMPAGIREESPSWHLDVHQIRITASASGAGSPAPEGPHQDGLTYIVTRLIALENATGGESAVLDLGKRVLWSGRLTRPFDAYYADDRRVMHDASPIAPADSSRTAHRDVLLFGFRPYDPVMDEEGYMLDAPR